MSGRMGVRQIAAVLFCCSTAHAFTTGIAGYSGKDGKLCTECHTQGTIKPKATLSGPSSLDAGATATYTLVIDTDVTTAASQVASPRQAGFDVAASAGTLGVLAQQNQTRLLAGEISHTSALPAAKTVQIMFTLTAPSDAQTVTLFAAALSADGDGTNKGDGTDATTLAVQVNGVAMPDLAPPPDLAGQDFAGVDFAEPPPPPDLAVPVDAVSSATAARPVVPKDMGPPRDEARWACGAYVGNPPSSAWPLFLVGALFSWRLGRRRASARRRRG